MHKLTLLLSVLSLQGYFSNYPKHVLLILTNEFCERFSYYGLRGAHTKMYTCHLNDRTRFLVSYWQTTN